MEDKPFVKYGIMTCITLISIGIIVNSIMIYYLYKIRESNYENSCSNGNLNDQLSELTFFTKGILMIILLIVGFAIIFGAILIPLSKTSSEV
jgi:hypothetical protein